VDQEEEPAGVDLPSVTVSRLRRPAGSSPWRRPWPGTSASGTGARHTRTLSLASVERPIVEAALTTPSAAIVKLTTACRRCRACDIDGRGHAGLRGSWASRPSWFPRPRRRARARMVGAILIVEVYALADILDRCGIRGRARRELRSDWARLLRVASITAPPRSVTRGTQRGQAGAGHVSAACVPAARRHQWQLRLLRACSTSTTTQGARRPHHRPRRRHARIDDLSPTSRRRGLDLARVSSPPRRLQQRGPARPTPSPRSPSSRVARRLAVLDAPLADATT
jgi:hypothetical protein